MGKPTIEYNKEFDVISGKWVLIYRCKHGSLSKPWIVIEYYSKEPTNEEFNLFIRKNTRRMEEQIAKHRERAIGYFGTKLLIILVGICVSAWSIFYILTSFDFTPIKAITSGIFLCSGIHLTKLTVDSLLIDRDEFL